MKYFVILAAVLVLAVPAIADSFGSGVNAFTIDFVPISGNASSANGTNISQYSPDQTGYKAFSDPANDYRMGTYEITNDQWSKFKAGADLANKRTGIYDSYFTGTNVPTNCTSWYEAARFVNYLNTSTGHTAAYKFTGSNYIFDVWGTGDADGTNLYRNKNALYFLPTEDEWVKAAYWNGTNLQTYATKAGDILTQGTSTNGGWNYMDGSDSGPDGSAEGPWNVGSGSQELNKTYDMMGNVWEWMESPYNTENYLSGSRRGFRGGSYYRTSGSLASSYLGSCDPYVEDRGVGFRVASIPEPCTLLLLGLGGMLVRKR